jgi:hypothetical protein
VIKVSLVSMGIEFIIGMSVMYFDMTFAKFLGFWEKLFEFNSKIQIIIWIGILNPNNNIQ